MCIYNDNDIRMLNETPIFFARSFMLKAALYVFIALESSNIPEIDADAFVAQELVKLDPCKLIVHGRSICRPNTAYPFLVMIESFPDMRNESQLTSYRLADLVTGRDWFRPGFTVVTSVG